MSDHSLHPDTTLGPAHLLVSNLDRSIAFYTEVLGFTLGKQEGDTATLTAGGDDPWLLLTALPGARPKPLRTTGLYHVAILVPSRAALARTIRRLAEQEYPLSGVADHLVSEALYLNDPDENGLEIYRDRPRDQWRFEDGSLKMATDPLDVRKLLTEGLADSKPWTGLDPQTRVGHVHLQVADLQAAVDFYSGVLGFDLMAQYGRSAAFVSAGGYHHHLGLNTWNSLGGTPPPANAVGLRSFDVVLPNEEELAKAAERLRAAAVSFDEQDGVLLARDPSSNTVRLRTA
jgi:catechol 2,3-dioxygenase